MQADGLEILDLVSFVERELSLINFALRGREKVKDFVPAGNLPTRLNPRHQSNVERQRVVEAGHEDLGIEVGRSEEHTSELQSLMRISYAVFCLKKKKEKIHKH